MTENESISSLMPIMYDQENGVRRCVECGEIHALFVRGMERPSLCLDCLAEALLNEYAAFQNTYAVSGRGGKQTCLFV